MTVPRGIRNNNPLNIRQGSKWRGLRREQTDKAFCQFVSIRYGLRAGFVLLRRYIQHYKLNTVPEIIHRWAPTSENDTENYINVVCSRAYISRSDFISIANKAQMCRLVEAMCFVECGQPVEMLHICVAYSMAIHV